MSNESKIGVRLPQELYDQVKAQAAERKLSISALMREVIEEKLGKGEQTLDNGEQMTNNVQQMVNLLQQQLEVANEGNARSDAIIMQLTKSVESQQNQIQSQILMIEDLQTKRTVWQRVKAVFSSQPA